ncbi:MAG: TadE family protein [Bacilli bacterium]|jgi:hypothetical protein
MNKRGQVLVFFVILIPIFTAIMAFTIDVGCNYYQYNKLNNINHIALQYGLNHLNDTDVRGAIIDLIYKNDSNIDSYELLIEDGKITLTINKTIDSVFGASIGIKFYSLSSKYIGYINNNINVIEKG